MSGGGEPWIAGFDPAIGTLVMPLWWAAVIAAVAICVFVLSRAGRDGLFETFARAGLLLAAAAVVWAVLDAMAASNFATQRRALDARFFEITTRATAPGSALACLDATAGDLVEAACEKALFASPEAAAAAATYVAAQLSLLAEGSEYERRSGANYEQALGGLRHAVEADRFGIVAHVLSDRDGCTADLCAAFGLLRDKSQVSENISEHKYESYVLHHATEWPQSSLSPVAANVPPAVAQPATPPPSGSPPQANAAPGKGLFFPSSASIPAVSIMSAEPSGSPPGTTAPDTPKAAGAPARKPVPPPAQTAKRPTNIAPPTTDQ